MTSEIKKALEVLKRDLRMVPLIKKYGPPDLKRYHGKISIFEALLRSIVYQQLSGKAASAIHKRVLALFPKNKPAPTALLKIRASKLRAAGLSIQKIGYVKDLARKCLDGTVDEKRFPSMSTAEIVEHLVAIKGVGEWTAHMALIFTLGRLDVLPSGDLGIRKGFRKVYGLRAMPEKKQMERLAGPWRPQASLASWYLWRVADEER